MSICYFAARAYECVFLCECVHVLCLRVVLGDNSRLTVLILSAVLYVVTAH